MYVWLVCTRVHVHVLGCTRAHDCGCQKSILSVFPQLFFIFCVEPGSLAELGAHQLALVSPASQPAHLLFIDKSMHSQRL